MTAAAATLRTGLWQLGERGLPVGARGCQEPGFLPRPRVAIVLAAVVGILAYGVVIIA